jgi:spore maturation protein CgeB
MHRPAAPTDCFRADLSYIGTYAEDRQSTLEELFVAAAHRAPDARFLIAGAQYPAEFPCAPNICFVNHLQPSQHPAFFASCRATLNVTRRAMAAMGWCPSGRLFEAAACGVAIVSDTWPGLDDFFRPGAEILAARTTADTLAVLGCEDRELRAIGNAARERVLAEHTSAHRADELLDLIERAGSTRTSVATETVEV